MWIKYRHKFAWCEEKDWTYLEIPNDWVEWGYDDMGDFLDHEENLAQEYNYSDKYRGFDYETVNKLPEEFILQQMKKCKDNIEYYKESLIKFGEML